MQDLKRLLRLGQRVTVTIQCSAVQWMNADSFLKILEQDGLAVPEIELWRAAIKWAKHRADSEDGQLLRRQLSGLIQHLRLCSLTMNEFGEEVATKDVLTDSEISAVCKSVAQKEKPRDLSDFSSETESRKRLQRKETVQDELAVNLKTGRIVYSSAEYDWTLLTKRNSIEFLPLVCWSENRDNMKPEKWTYKVNCTVKITEVVNPNNTESSSANEPPITVSFSENVQCGVEFEIPLAVDGRNVTLLPDTKYTVKMTLIGKHRYYYSNDTGSGSFGNDDLTLAITPHNIFNCFPSTKLQVQSNQVVAIRMLSSGSNKLLIHFDCEVCNIILKVKEKN